MVAEPVVIPSKTLRIRLDSSGACTYTIEGIQDLIPRNADIFGFDIPLSDDLKQVEVSFGCDHATFTRQNYFALASFHVHLWLSMIQRKDLRLVWDEDVLRRKAIIIDGVSYADVVVPDITIRLMTIVRENRVDSVYVPFYSCADLSGMSTHEQPSMEALSTIDSKNGLMISYVKYKTGFAIITTRPPTLTCCNESVFCPNKLLLPMEINVRCCRRSAETASLYERPRHGSNDLNRERCF
jgi:hypothetical protein